MSTSVNKNKLAYYVLQSDICVCQELYYGDYNDVFDKVREKYPTLTGFTLKEMPLLALAKEDGLKFSLPPKGSKIRLLKDFKFHHAHQWRTTLKEGDYVMPAGLVLTLRSIKYNNAVQQISVSTTAKCPFPEWKSCKVYFSWGQLTDMVYTIVEK